jgi:hypothetical protein
MNGFKDTIIRGENTQFSLNDDGKIDIVDMMLVAIHWEDTCDEQ